MPQNAQLVLDVMRDFMGYNIGRREIPTCPHLPFKGREKRRVQNDFFSGGQ